MIFKAGTNKKKDIRYLAVDRWPARIREKRRDDLRCIKENRRESCRPDYNAYQIVRETSARIEHKKEIDLGGRVIIITKRSKTGQPWVRG